MGNFTGKRTHCRPRVAEAPFRSSAVVTGIILHILKVNYKNACTCFTEIIQHH